MAPKLHGRAFYESIGSPKFILAPMVDQSEFAWRMLTRSFMTPETDKSLLAYSPMFHARLFAETPRYRSEHFQPTNISSPSADNDQAHQQPTPELYLDGNTKIDRPLFVQFCANNPDELLAAAKHVQPYCDAVDLNLGCPQGIAKRGHYGAFLQEDWATIYNMINKLHKELDIPVTAKMRVLETREKTLEYAKTILSAGASILTVHGRLREQKGHLTGLADWKMLRYLRENLPPETVMFANGNILQHEDVARCLAETGVDGVMSAEGNLYDPSIFGEPPQSDTASREYWRGRDGKGGYRMDAVLRRYLDIIHKYVLGQEQPARKPLFMPSDPVEIPAPQPNADEIETETINDREGDILTGPPPKKKQRLDQSKGGKKFQKSSSPNLVAMQAHLFHLLRPLVSKRTHVRDALARCKSGDIDSYENVLSLVEEVTREGLIEYEKGETTDSKTEELDARDTNGRDPESLVTIARCKRPWFICQPYVRPLPKEALEKGAIALSKKDKARIQQQEAEKAAAIDSTGGSAKGSSDETNGASAKVDEVAAAGDARLEREQRESRNIGVHAEGRTEHYEIGGHHDKDAVEIPRDGLVSG